MELNLSVLAIYAILALVIERFMEIFSEIWRVGRHKFKIDETKSRIADLQTKINELAKDKNEPLSSLNPLQDERRKKQRELMLLERDRVILFLVIGAVLGIGVSFVLNFVLKIELFKLFGFDIDIPRVWDSIISGLVIGSGTKPTHDIIGIIENVVRKK